MTSSDLPFALRATASSLDPHREDVTVERAQHLMRVAADELEEWRAVDHNPPPFDENGVMNDPAERLKHEVATGPESHRAEIERLRDGLGEIAQYDGADWDHEGVCGHAVDVLKAPSLVEHVNDADAKAQDERGESLLRAIHDIPQMVSDELRAKLAAKAQHKLELNRRGWDYDEAQGGFMQVPRPNPFPWPLVPMREQHDSDEAYTRAMVAWGKAVHEIERDAT